MCAKILIRFDDICPTMDWEQFQKAKLLMDRYGIKPLLGVIPHNEDPDQMIASEKGNFWEYMRKLKGEGYAIAMHGYTHVYDQKKPKTIVCGKKHSEFAGNTYDNQFQKIKQGKEIMNSNGVHTEIFFAPAHTYDMNTLKALKDNGFRYLSDGKADHIYIQEGIICIPCRSTSVPIVGTDNLYTSVSHPSEWRRSDKRKDYYLLEKLCAEHRDKIVDFETMIAEEPLELSVAKKEERRYMMMSFCNRAFRVAKRHLLRG